MSATEADTLASVGEGEALARILPLLPGSSDMDLGPGDDSAVLRTSDNRVVISCDMMVEGPDFQWSWSDPEQVGFKAIASNAADIAAMGAVVTAFEIAVAAPEHTPVVLLERLARGFANGITELTPGAGVAGGDLSRSPVFTIAITVLGDLQGRSPVTRQGAKPGDLVCVAGELGLSRAGYLELVAAAGDPERISSLKATSLAVSHHLSPRPPIALGPIAADHGATAMMDISDGLVLDATRMAKASGVTIDLDVSEENALIGGEDHGLLACFPEGCPIPGGFQVIGRVLPANSATPVVVAGFDLGAIRGGWDPFQDFSATNTVVSP
jgi:thiamine-monophosphate kinase